MILACPGADFLLNSDDGLEGLITFSQLVTLFWEHLFSFVLDKNSSNGNTCTIVLVEV